MSTPISASNRPWLWLAREASIIAFFALALVSVSGVDGFVIARVMVGAALAGVILFLSMRVVADILVAGFCRWTAAMGHGLGTLAGAICHPRRRN